MDDFRKIIYGTLIVFVVGIVAWIGFIAISGCGFTPSCLGAAPIVVRTPIPTLIPATLPVSIAKSVAPTAQPQTQTASSNTIARPSNPGGAGAAIDIAGNADLGSKVYSANCIACHGANGAGGIPNPGSSDGTVPPLNPIDPSLISSDYKTYATNLDLFIEHGSAPAGPSPILGMVAWGDKGALTPHQIADVIAYLIKLNPAPVVTASGPAATKESSDTANVARPSNPGGPGKAVDLTGDAAQGSQIFASNCIACHAAQGAGGVPNPGSSDGTVPELNPIDPTLKSADYKTFASNIDLFIEHGSTPGGPAPAFSMPAWGDKGVLTPQQIANVIAYVISLNGGATGSVPSTGSTSVTSTPIAATPTVAASVATPTASANGLVPSNPGGPGAAIGMTGSADSGKKIFAANCVACHSDEGKGGVANPGSTDGTVPALNPVNPKLKNADHKIFATNLDLFIEHGSTPKGASPNFNMPAWGDGGTLSPQQIADVIAYLLSLNP